MPLLVAGKQIELTEEGFLKTPSQWDWDVAAALALAHNLELTEAHRELLILLRQYCDDGNEPPSMRVFAAEIRKRTAHDAEHAKKSSSLYLMTLFGSSPAKMAARLAGLPKPKNCL